MSCVSENTERKGDHREMIQGMGFTEVAFGIGITIAVALIAFWIWLSIWNSRQPLEKFSVKVVAKRT